MIPILYYFAIIFRKEGNIQRKRKKRERDNAMYIQTFLQKKGGLFIVYVSEESLFNSLVFLPNIYTGFIGYSFGFPFLQ